jgi:peptide/nickel transport system substrate-binding protein
MLVTGLAGALVAPAGSPAAASAAPSVPPPGHRASTLTVALLQGVDSLNPFQGTFVSSTQMFRLAYDFLTDYDPRDNSPRPGLAESWSVSPDGHTWTYRIRQGATWSDGKPVTAADVAFTYNLILRGPARGTANSALVKTFKAVTAPAPDTLVITTTVPTTTMLALDIPIVPAHVWSRIPDVREYPNTPAGGRPVVSSGPFQLVEARANQFYRFRANPRHPTRAPNVDELVFQYFTSSDAAVQALRKGEVDAVGNLTPAQYEALGAEPSVGRNAGRGNRFTELGFNPGARRADGTRIGDGHPALADRRLREAVEFAIDRPALVKRVFQGHAEPGAGYLPPAATPWSWQPAGSGRRGFDPARANQLLDAAGYRRGPGGVRTTPDGRRPLRLRLYVPPERAHYQQAATYLKEWLRVVGIDVRPRLVPDTQLGSLVEAGRYDLFLGGWLADPDPDFLLSVHGCAALPGADGGTDSYFCDPGYDRLYAEQARQTDRAKRIELVHRMQEQLYREASPIILYYPASLEAYRKDRFTGFVSRPAPSGSILGYWSYTAAGPVTGSADTGSGGAGAGVALGAGAAAAVAVGGLILYRRRTTRDQRE